MDFRGVKESQVLDEYQNIDLRPASLDSVGRLTKDDILWACTQAQTVCKSSPILTPSQLDPAFCRMRGYSDYYTSCLTLRNRELPDPKHELAPDLPVVMLLGRKGTNMDRRTMMRSHLVPAAKQSFKTVTAMLQSDFLVFDTVIVDPRWANVGMIVTVALRKLQAAHPERRMIVAVFPGRVMLASVANAFFRFGFHPYGGTDVKRFIPASKPGPCLVMFSTRIADMLDLEAKGPMRRFHG